MKIMLVAASGSGSAYLERGFRESLNDLYVVGNLHDARRLASHEQFDAIVISVVDCTQVAALLEFLPEFASLTPTSIILVALGGASAEDCTRILRAGAGACVLLPYSFLDLQDRMLELYRATAVHSSPAGAATASTRVDPLTREFIEDGKRLLLTKREFPLIEYLLRHANLPVARQQLLRDTWSGIEKIDPASLNLVISHLRRKLLRNGFRVRIETLGRHGYQLTENFD